MEKPILGINMDAAFSFLTEGADQPVANCSLELPIAPPGHDKLKYICIGMLYGMGPFKF